MTEPSDHNYENFDDLLPAYTPPEDMFPTEVVDGTLTAEAIGYSSLSRKVLRKQRGSPVILFDKAWSVVELGLTAPSTHTRQGFLDIAEQRFDMVLDDPEATRELRLRTIMARVAIPSFRARAEHRRLTRDLRTETYRHLGELLTAEVTDEFYDGRGVKEKGITLGFLCENLTYAMLLRSNAPFFPFPAAPREDRSSVVEQNHDLYIPHKNTKFPIQVKRQQGAISDDIIGVKLLNHIKPAISASLAKEISERRVWTKHYQELEPDVLLARYLDRGNPHYSQRDPSVAEETLEAVSKSVGSTVHSQMDKLLNKKEAAAKS